jgi:repressor LexA
MAAKIWDMEDEVIEYIEKYSEENGFSPSVREIAAFVGNTSTSTVYNFIENQVMKGVLKKAGNKSRSISIIKIDGKHER